MKIYTSLSIFHIFTIYHVIYLSFFSFGFAKKVMPKKQWKTKQHTQDDDFSVWSGPSRPQLIFLRP